MNDKHTNRERNIKTDCAVFEIHNVKKSSFPQGFMTLLRKETSYEKGWKM
ncbi:hypothetical protein GCM10008139_16360 [Staphylococcus chromogenes]|nr:hypothetical protein GCM10008139_16360 [Staphylococcus chromogenes]